MLGKHSFLLGIFIFSLSPIYRQEDGGMLCGGEDQKPIGTCAQNREFKY